MLRISNSKLMLTSQGYHFDEHGKKFVRVFTSLNFIKIQVKIQPHKEMHIKAINASFPYTITDNWVEIIAHYWEMYDEDWLSVNDYIDRRCKEIWFV